MPVANSRVRGLLVVLLVSALQLLVMVVVLVVFQSYGKKCIEEGKKMKAGLQKLEG